MWVPFFCRLYKKSKRGKWEPFSQSGHPPADRRSAPALRLFYHNPKETKALWRGGTPRPRPEGAAQVTDTRRAKGKMETIFPKRAPARGPALCAGFAIIIPPFVKKV